jgi:hypothetical protein
MAGYVYIKSEPHLWTVGFYDPEGIWHPDSDKPSKDEAANRVRFLNGGFVTKGDEDIQDRKTNKDVITVKVELKNDDVNYFQEADVSPPQILEASGKTAAMLALMERMGMLPDNMSEEAIKSLGLKEAKLDAQPDITILIDGKAVKLDLLQFSGVTAVVSKCLDEIDEKINRIRRFSGRN